MHHFVLLPVLCQGSNFSTSLPIIPLSRFIIAISVTWSGSSLFLIPCTIQQGTAVELDVIGQARRDLWDTLPRNTRFCGLAPSPQGDEQKWTLPVLPLVGAINISAGGRMWLCKPMTFRMDGFPEIPPVSLPHASRTLLEDILRGEQKKFVWLGDFWFQN